MYFDINNIYFYPIYIQFLFIYFPAMHPENPQQLRKNPPNKRASTRGSRRGEGLGGDI